MTSSSPPPHAGQLLAGRYRLEERLGAGDFGEVFKATQVPFGREVAVKVLLMPTPDAAARFAREAALAQRLEHPNTARILDFGVSEEGVPFMVWELLRGQTLADLVAVNGPLDLGVALRITSQILKSMLEAHALGIVHRDLKPANIFVTSHPGEPAFVRVLDFGIAKEVLVGTANEPVSARSVASESETGARATHQSQLLGTPRYMAPEQARGEIVGPRADLYATGLVLAELLSGVPVFDGASGLEVALAQASDAPAPLPPMVTASQAGPIVMRATQKFFEDRYASAAEMLADIEALASQHKLPSADVFRVGDPRVGGSLATAPTEATPSLRRRQRARFALPVLAFGLLAVATTGALLTRFFLKGAHKPSSSQTLSASRSALGEPSIDWSTRTIPDLPFEAFEERMKKAGYTLHRQSGFGGSDWKFFSTAVGKDPCTGMFGLYLFDPKASSTERASIEDSIRRIQSARLISQGDKFLYAVVGSPTSPECDPKCSDQVAAILTDR